MKVLIIHGPNLNLLGEREPDIYGNENLQELNHSLMSYGRDKGIEVEVMQSNHEGVIVDAIQQARHQFDGIVINAGAYTHYSYAIRDALAALTLPVVEVHISNIYKRESFRHHSVIAPVVCGQITGLGTYSYFLAVDYLIQHHNLKDRGNKG